MSSDALGRLPIKLVAPITGRSEAFERNLWHVRFEPDQDNGLSKISAVDTLQLRGLDLQRFVARLGQLNAIAMEEIVAAIATVVEFQSDDDTPLPTETTAIPP